MSPAPRSITSAFSLKATVSTPAVIDALFRRLAAQGHELVLFDINRRAEAEPLLRREAMEAWEDLLAGPPLGIELNVLTNAGAKTDDMIAQRRAR